MLQLIILVWENQDLMHFNKNTCSVCGQEIVNDEEQIKNHILCHEKEWFESLREKYRV